MSCDSGIGMSPESVESQTRKIKDEETCVKSSRAAEVDDVSGKFQSNEVEVTEGDPDSPVSKKRGMSTELLELQSEESEETREDEEPVQRRSRGRPKGAKNKNPKPKPPPKPKRPKGRPRKHSQFLSERVTRQSFARIEPVSERPPDNIFEDSP